MKTPIESPLEDYTKIARQAYYQWFGLVMAVTWTPYLTIADTMIKARERDKKESDVK